MKSGDLIGDIGIMGSQKIEFFLRRPTKFR